MTIPLQHGTRRRLLRAPALIACAAALGALASGAAFVQRARPPHAVILIVLDTVRADSLGCYGSARGATPHLDRFAADAVRFEQAVGHAPWTLPSVASLLTSTYPSTHGALGDGLALHKFSGKRPSITSGAAAFRKAGYRTRAIVNAMFLDENLGLNEGFEGYDIDYATVSTLRRADECVTRALEWLRRHARERTFLLLHLFDPHLRYDPPAGWADGFVGSYAGALRGLPPPDLDVLTLRMARREVRPAPEDAEYLRGLHLAELAFVDAQLGRLLDGLKALGIYDRSTIVVTADHGEEFWDHGAFEHGQSLYDELVRLPLLVKPARPAAGDPPRGRVVREQVRQIDIMPTLLELSGIAPPATFEGESFAAAVRDPRAPLAPRETFLEAPLYDRLVHVPGREAPLVIDNELIAWRADGFKYILNLSDGRGELYDLTADPGERVDLAARDAQRAAAMRRRLLVRARELFERAARLEPAPPFDMNRGELRNLAALGYLRSDADAPDGPALAARLAKVRALEGATP